MLNSQRMRRMPSGLAMTGMVPVSELLCSSMVRRRGMSARAALTVPRRPRWPSSNPTTWMPSHCR